MSSNQVLCDELKIREDVFAKTQRHMHLAVYDYTVMYVKSDTFWAKEDSKSPLKITNLYLRKFNWLLIRENLHVEFCQSAKIKRNQSKMSR